MKKLKNLLIPLIASAVLIPSVAFSAINQNQNYKKIKFLYKNEGVLIGDFNNDGKQDMIFYNKINGEIEFHYYPSENKDSPYTKSKYYPPLSHDPFAIDPKELLEN